MKMKNSILKFIKSPYALIVYLIVFVIVLLIINYKQSHSTQIFIFNGYNEEFTVMDGSIYIDRKINNFTSPNILYNGKEILLKEYKIGYYILINDELKKISVKEKNDNGELIKLTELVRNSEFSFTEYHKNANYFSKQSIENIENLCFVITGIDKDNNEVTIKLDLEVTNITKKGVL